jgi:hypothetical protein
VKSKIGATLAKEIKALGIALVSDDGSALKFKCKSCGKAWSIKWDGSEEALRDWWRCPGGCNANLARSPELNFRGLRGEGQKSPK